MRHLALLGVLLLCTASPALGQVGYDQRVFANIDPPRGRRLSRLKKRVPQICARQKGGPCYAFSTTWSLSRDPLSDRDTLALMAVMGFAGPICW